MLRAKLIQQHHKQLEEKRGWHKLAQKELRREGHRRVLEDLHRRERGASQRMDKSVIETAAAMS